MTGREVDPLAGLRGYHLPDALSWWPPAPGWWVMMATLLALVIGLAVWLYRRRRRTAAARLALRELQLMRREHAQHGDSLVFVRQLSRLLRRYAMASFPRQEVAALSGGEWLHFLDRHARTTVFTTDDGAALVEASYRGAAVESPERYAALVEDWIRHNRDSAR